MPFVLVAWQLQGIKRIVLIGSLAIVKVDPKDINVLLSLDDAADLALLATANRKLQGRVTSLTHSIMGRISRRKPSAPLSGQPVQAQRVSRLPPEL